MCIMNDRLPHRVETETTSMALVKVQEEPHDLLASRRNIFDGDEFDVFSGNAVDRSKVSRGKKG
jgi:activating signal cointegrator complex subunit 2